MKAPGALRGPLAGAAVIGRWSCWDLRRVGPATWFPARSRAGVRYGTAYPTGSRGSSGASGRSAPGARLPGGVPISPEKWGERGPGAGPLDPQFYGPLVSTRWFWRLCRIVPVVGLLRCPCTCPDLDSHFAGAGVGCESILLQGHTTCEGFPLGGSCHRR